MVCPSPHSSFTFHSGRGQPLPVFFSTALSVELSADIALSDGKPLGWTVRYLRRQGMSDLVPGH